MWGLGDDTKENSSAFHTAGVEDRNIHQYDDFVTSNFFDHYYDFVSETHQLMINFPHKGSGIYGILGFYLLSAWTKILNKLSSFQWNERPHRLCVKVFKFCTLPIMPILFVWETTSHMYTVDETKTNSNLYPSWLIDPYMHRRLWTCSWWRHQMETFSALLAICAGNSPVIGEFPSQRPVTRIFDIFFDLRLNKWLSKQSWGY